MPSLPHAVSRSNDESPAARVEARELEDFIRVGFQLVGTARRAAARIGECPAAWDLLKAAADAERALLLLELELEEAGQVSARGYIVQGVP